MTYAMADLERQTGFTSRTIREYIRLGYIPRPEGQGPAAVYTEDHLLRAVCIARMTAQGMLRSEIGEQIPHWSIQKLRAYVKKTNPPPEPALQPPSPSQASDGSPGAPALGGDPFGQPPKLLEAGASAVADLGWRTGDAQLPQGPRWVLVSLLPGMALMVRDDAAPVVKRAAAEIIERFGTGDRAGAR